MRNDEGEIELYGKEWCRRRRLPNVHLIQMLRARELGARKSGTHFFNGARQFYQCIHPSKATPNVDRKNYIPKKFSPDGRYLVCLMINFHVISVHEYAGMFGLSKHDPTTLFEVLFPEKFALNLCLYLPEGSLVSKDCFFITPDSRHLIVAANYQLPESEPTLSQIYSNNESLEPPPQTLHRIVFFCIDLARGEICDMFVMSVDRVWVPHGVHLVGRLLGILSLQHQIIHFIHIDENSGQFLPITQVGRFLFDDDFYVLSASGQRPLNTDLFLSSVKQRLLSYMFRRCVQNGRVDYFMHNFPHLRALRMWQMIIVSSDVILLRFVNREALASTTTINVQPALFVFMNWRTGEVLSAYDRYSNDFLSLLETFQEDLKLPHILNNRFPCTMQHCQAASVYHHRLKSALSSAKGGSPMETRRRILCQLPYSTVYAYSESPYLDPSMFSYDDKLLALIERMKIPGHEVIRFFSRVTQQPLFEIRIGAARFAHLLFHPTEPLAISFDRTRSYTPLTLHMPPSVTARE